MMGVVNHVEVRSQLCIVSLGFKVIFCQYITHVLLVRKLIRVQSALAIYRYNATYRYGTLHSYLKYTRIYLYIIRQVGKYPSLCVHFLRLKM